jgi:hypothetical protein
MSAASSAPTPKKPASRLKRALGPLALGGILLLLGHFAPYLDGARATVRYRLDELGLASPAQALHVQLYPQEDPGDPPSPPVARAFIRLDPSRPAIPQEISLTPGTYRVEGRVETAGGEVPIQGQLQVERSGKYDVYLRQGEEKAGSGGRAPPP